MYKDIDLIPDLNSSNPSLYQDIEMCTDSLCDAVHDSFESFNFQPMSGHTVTLHGNGGTINGANTLTINVSSPVTIGSLPRATPQNLFIGWSFTRTGQTAHPQILVDSNMTLFAIFSNTLYNQMNRRQLAQELLDRHYGRSLPNRRIYIRRGWGSMSCAARTSPYMNIVDTAAGLQATRAAISNQGATIGGTVFLNENLLRAILRVNDHYGTVTLNSLAGGRHATNSRHYQGRAVDFQSTNFIVDGTGVRFTPIVNYLRNSHGFNTGSSYENYNFFHLEILN